VGFWASTWGRLVTWYPADLPPWLSRTPPRPQPAAVSGSRLGEVAPHPAQTVELLFGLTPSATTFAQGMREGYRRPATATFLGLACLSRIEDYLEIVHGESLEVRVAGPGSVIYGELTPKS